LRFSRAGLNPKASSWKVTSLNCVGSVMRAGTQEASPIGFFHSLIRKLDIDYSRTVFIGI